MKDRKIFIWMAVTGIVAFVAAMIGIADWGSGNRLVSAVIGLLLLGCMVSVSLALRESRRLSRLPRSRP